MKIFNVNTGNRFADFLNNGIAQAIIAKGYSHEFAEWAYNHTNQFDIHHADMGYILDAMNTGVDEVEIKQQVTSDD